MKTKRITVELDAEKFNALKGELALSGITISQWLRLCVDIFLKEHVKEKDVDPTK